MASTATSPRALKRALKDLKTREQLASTWLVRLGLFLALAAWAYDEYYSSRAAPTSRSSAKGGQGAAKQLLLMGVAKLALRWYFTRERRELDERVLEDDSKESRHDRSKRSKSDKRR
ncbi:hypothetical protein JCM8208_003457 [Rhodotorula glutinis]